MAMPTLRRELAAVRAELATYGASTALGALRTYMQREGLSPEEIDAAGRLLRRIVAEHPELSLQRWRVRLVGQCTTSWLANAVAALAWCDGLLLEVSEAGFDVAMQDAIELAQTDPQAQPHFVCLVPWLRSFDCTNAEAAQARADFEASYWRGVWEQLGATRARLIQVGYDSTNVGPAGFHLSGTCGTSALIGRLNEALRRDLPAGAYFVDLPLVAGEMGRRAFYDARRFVWTKQPFSEAGCSTLAAHIAAGTRALLTGPKKVLVLDLDNTVWGGVVGETGPLDVDLGETPAGESFRNFQHYVKSLAARGVVLAVASKNDPADARGPFESNPGMVLRLADIAAFEASWSPKAESLERIARTLGLGLDSFVFFDDNPAEREHIRQALPQVAVVPVPAEPADYVRALEAGLWFETVRITDEDQQRVKHYQAEPQRQLLRDQTKSLEDYLASLEMAGLAGDVTGADLARVVQLLGKTNQFNLTTRRHTAEEVCRLLAVSRSIGFTLRLADRFGDYGLIAVVLATPQASSGDSDVLVIDSWLMSCRVIGRTVEHFIMDELVRRARDQGFQQLVGTYAPTGKNSLVEELYPSLGFRPLPVVAGAAERRYVLDIDRPVAFSTQVRSIASNEVEMIRIAPSHERSENPSP